jgi:hypothetical protein
VEAEGDATHIATPSASSDDAEGLVEPWCCVEDDIEGTTSGDAPLPQPLSMPIEPMHPKVPLGDRQPELEATVGR